MSTQLKPIHLNSFKCDYSEETKSARMKEIDKLLEENTYNVLRMYGKYYLNAYHFHGEQRYFGLDYEISEEECKIIAQKLGQKSTPEYVAD